MTVRRVLVTGATGQLGAAVVHEFRRDHEVVAPGHAECDLTDHDAVVRIVTEARPDVVINCAGYNAVDAAEDHAELTLRVNAFGAGSLARATAAIGAAFVHYGTDFVFDGRTDRPYTEDDRPDPQSVYACSKLLGEWFALEPGARRPEPGARGPEPGARYVLRVESLFGHVPGEGRGPKGSVAGILDGLSAGREVPVFVDRTVSPTYIVDAAAATRRILEGQLPPGLYHCVNSGRCSWYEFAEEAARQLGVTPRLKAVRLDDLKLRASRPKYCALSNAKLASRGITMPSWQDALARYLKVRASNDARAI